MNDNNANDLDLKGFAHYTGRSLLHSRKNSKIHSTSPLADGL